MKIKALITLLVLGSTSVASSVAMARPVLVSGYEGAPVVRDHRVHRISGPAPAPAPAPAPEVMLPAPPPFVPQWTTLGTESRIIDGAMSFRAGAQMGRFIALKLQSTAGKSLINRVEIKFANGRTQLVEVNKYLNASSPTITIDLAGEDARAIKGVTVVGRNARQSAYSVLAI